VSSIGLLGVGLAWAFIPTQASAFPRRLVNGLATRQVHLAREAGALRVLPLALHYLAGVNIQAGKLHQAVAMIEEAQAITTATGSAPMAYAWLVLLGWRGQEEPAFGLIDAILQEATAPGRGNGHHGSRVRGRCGP
jgi:hypothetical protein